MRGNSKVKNDKRDRLEKRGHKFRKIVETLISKVNLLHKPTGNIDRFLFWVNLTDFKDSCLKRRMRRRGRGGRRRKKEEK